MRRPMLGKGSWGAGALLFAWMYVATGAAHAAKIPASCATAREYITALEFLRADGELKTPEEQARQIARQVASGCTGAAARLIRVAQLLSRAGMFANDAMKIGVEFAGRTDREAETFTAVFKRAFVAESLDLDLPASVKLARALSTEFEGDVLAVRDDFERVVDFCVHQEKLALPKPRCAQLGAEVARAGQAWSGGVAQPFLKLLEFSTLDTQGPKLATDQGLKLALDLTRNGPEAADTFSIAYRYAVSDKGLQFPRDEAIRFARDLAQVKTGD